jgi:hypothetical protein
VTAVKSTTGGEIPKQQVREAVVRAAQDFDAFYEGREQQAQEEVNASGQVLVLTTDGKGVPMRREALREQTRRAAESKPHKLDKRLSRGEKRHRKRMATVASVYTVAPMVRTPEQVMRTLAPVRDASEKQVRPRPENKRVWASVEKPVETVIEEAFEEGERRDPGYQKKWCAVVDGNKPQLRLLQKYARRFGVALTIVLDIIHVAEYLWKAVLAFHAEGSRELEDWVGERLLEVLRGRASQVAAGMRRSATLRGLSAAKRAPVDTCANYLLKYGRYMRYDQYLADGLPIASGVVEGACRHLVKDRMERGGARWGLAGAEAVLRLRALRSSGDFEEYWQFHETQEHKRNHLDRYADGQIPEIQTPKGKRQPDHLRAVKQ